VTALDERTTGLTAERGPFGVLADGSIVESVELRNSQGVRARVIAYGATLQSLQVPDRHGRLDAITLGHDTIAPYERQRQFLGATVGRYANRIAAARFVLDGRSYQLAKNDGAQSLHGGSVGFDQRLWSIAQVQADHHSASVTLCLHSADGDQGYPGNMTVRVTYALSEANDLSISYLATTDKTTIVNLTHHSYFNLAGLLSGRSALDSTLQVESDAFTPIDAQLLPIGEIRAVAGTALDFRQPAILAARARDVSDSQVLLARGIDHNFVIRGAATRTPRLSATLHDPQSGRELRVLSTEPGLQIYTANHMDGTIPGHSGQPMRQGDGIALEAQKYPDTPNQPHFPSARLDPGQNYEQLTVYSLRLTHR